MSKIAELRRIFEGRLARPVMNHNEGILFLILDEEGKRYQLYRRVKSRQASTPHGVILRPQPNIYGYRLRKFMKPYNDNRGDPRITIDFAYSVREEEVIAHLPGYIPFKSDSIPSADKVKMKENLKAEVFIGTHSEYGFQYALSRLVDSEEGRASIIHGFIQGIEKRFNRQPKTKTYVREILRGAGYSDKWWYHIRQEEVPAVESTRLVRDMNDKFHLTNVGIIQKLILNQLS